MTVQTVTTKALLNRKELCIYMNMSWNTIEKKVLHREDFPKKKFGEKWLFHKELVDEFLLGYYLEKPLKNCS
ncbi:hypothetical protein [Jeotgalibacillus terrae]|uniref:Helix-turn-helix domain-containing protein n=1 Tax=Jeotgalibacillus terrae TaxID=587735 RepID=A0ABW5ZKP0_9BACL|nr:hypothetical protein [Jeotgalibacillus terrae]MBM7578247.1 excisionase family DNA binding protein [Jeotgalibacillus terrae]